MEPLRRSPRGCPRTACPTRASATGTWPSPWPLREDLRALLLANNGGELDPAVPAALNAAAERARLTVALDAAGRATVTAQADGIDRVAGRLLGIVARAQAEGTWERLKACPWHTCHVAFYDHSRNHSRTWCSMAVCGNRAKAQTYRRARA